MFIGLITRRALVFSNKKKKALTTGIVKTFVVAEAGFEPTTFGL
jgi:hypothetical protein